MDDPRGRKRESINMDALVSVEVTGVPSRTRGSVVYALLNRILLSVPQQQSQSACDDSMVPLQWHLFTGDAIWSRRCQIRSCDRAVEGSIDAERLSPTDARITNC